LNYIDNWEETKQRFMAWWDRSGMDRPLMKVTARKDGYQCRFTRNPVFYPVYTSGYKSPEDYFLNVEKNVEQYRNYFRSHKLYAESFPNFDVNLGAGSLALYLGCEPEFAEYTIWFKECIKDNWNEVMPLKFNPENKWWKKHLEMIDKALELINGEFPVGIPDIVENVDILSAMRGPQKFCYDLIDEPDLMFELLRQLDDLYFRYYDDIYERVALKDGGSVYTVFQIWGPGKTAKVQCDFCAMMSPSQFRDFVVPSMRRQCKRLDSSIYHLDGPDAIKHLDALMEIEELDAVQWTPGAGKPDGGDESWYPIYDKVVDAGKALWIDIYQGSPDVWFEKADKLVKRYGSKYLYLLFGEMDEREANDFLKKVAKTWR
jgi:hypothetical protein